MKNKNKTIKTSLMTALLGATTLLSTTAFADAGDWLKQSGDFITLNRTADHVEIFVSYPRLGGGNCGIGIALNRGYSSNRFYQQLLEQVTVTDLYSYDSEGLTPISVDRSGVLFEFNANVSAYGTMISISVNDGKTFGEVFDSMSYYGEVHALASPVSCAQLEEKKS